MDVEEEAESQELKTQRKHCLESRLIHVLKKRKDQVVPLDQVVQLIQQGIKLFKPSEELIRETLEVIIEKDYAEKEGGGFRYKA